MGLIDKFKNMFTEEVEEDEVVVEKKIETKQEVVNKEEKLRRCTEIDEQYEPPIRTAPTRVTPKIEDDIIVKKYERVDNIPVKEEKEVVNVSTKPVEQNKPLKREEKFVFPVYFDDKDFEKIEEKKPKVEEPKKIEKKEVYGTKIEKKEPPKIFKPTPIISPIYGVLDKNYHKDDIATKKVTHTEYRDPSKPLTIDEVRRKAYGTLEDDIETSLIAKSSIFMENDTTIEEKQNSLLTDLVDEEEYSSVDEFLNSPIEDYEARHQSTVKDKLNLDDTLTGLEDSISETIKNIESKTSRTTSLDDLLTNTDNDDNLLEDYIMNNTEENAENKYEDEDLTQSDLFNLIDSMYEKGEEE